MQNTPLLHPYVMFSVKFGTKSITVFRSTEAKIITIQYNREGRCGENQAGRKLPEIKS